MITVLARQFYREAQKQERGTETRKRATTAFGILVDKWTIVSGRPTAIIKFEDVQRVGALELAQRLALAAKESA